MEKRPKADVRLLAAFSQAELDNLKEWAKTTPLEQAKRLEEFLSQPEIQNQIGQAVGAMMQPIMEPLMLQVAQEIEAEMGVDREKLAELITDKLNEKVRQIEERLEQIEAALFRRRLCVEGARRQ